MIFVSTQLNTPGAQGGQPAHAGSAMPFGFTFALQSLRAAYRSIEFTATHEGKDATPGQLSDGSRSRVQWGAYRG